MCVMWTTAAMEVMAVGYKLASGCYLLLKCKHRLLCFMLDIGFSLIFFQHVYLPVSPAVLHSIGMIDPHRNILLAWLLRMHRLKKKKKKVRMHSVEKDGGRATDSWARWRYKGPIHPQVVARANLFLTNSSKHFQGHQLQARKLPQRSNQLCLFVSRQ